MSNSSFIPLIPRSDSLSSLKIHLDSKTSLFTTIDKNENRPLSKKQFARIGQIAFEEIKQSAANLTLSQKDAAYHLLANTERSFSKEIHHPRGFLGKIPLIQSIFSLFLQLSSRGTRKEFHCKLEALHTSNQKEMEKNWNEICLDPEILIPFPDLKGLIKANEDHNKSPLARAAKRNNLAAVKHFLSNGADANSLYKGFPTLYYVIVNGHNEIYEHLIENAKADVTVLSKYTNEALVAYAAKSNNLQAVKHLLANGADVNAADIIGNTALHYAVINNYKEMTQLLINTPGIDVEAQTKRKETPLYLSVFFNSHKVLPILIEEGHASIKPLEEHLKNEKTTLIDKETIEYLAKYLSAQEDPKNA